MASGGSRWRGKAEASETCESIPSVALGGHCRRIVTSALGAESGQRRRLRRDRRNVPPSRLLRTSRSRKGTYDLATLTPLERPSGAKGALSADEAAQAEAKVAAQTEAGRRSISADRTAPPKGGDGSVGAAGAVGGYNNFWLDPG
jgi:hypothetical protein